MIAVIDNYDSFTYNLVQFMGELQEEHPVAEDIRVWRNDEIDVEELMELNPSHIVISPGPGSPGGRTRSRARAGRRASARSGPRVPSRETNDSSTSSASIPRTNSSSG